MRKLLLLVFCVFSSLCNAQYMIEECINEDILPTYTHNRNNITYDSRYGCVFSPSGTLRVLIVFAEIEYDLHPNMDPNSNNNTTWPKGGYPIWCDQLFDNEITNNQCCGSVTKYYREASFNNYTVLGDYLIKGNNDNSIFKIKESDGYTYTSATGNIAETILFNKINQEMTTGPITAHGYNSISYFDNWTTTGSGEAKITPSVDNPRKFDCIVVIWRNRIKNEKLMNNSGYVGDTNMDLFGYGMDFCINVGTFERIPTAIIRHEYAHGLLGGNNFHTAGGGEQFDYFIPFTGGWGMLGLSGSSLQCCNGWDRQRLGWKSASNTYDISARAADGITEVSGDIDFNTGNGIYVLRDFLTTGDALRIKLPFIDEEREYQEWIWLENHAGRHYNNSGFDVWHYELDYDCIDSFPGGLMAYIQIDKNIRVSDDCNDVYGGFGGYTRPLVANGFYERSYESNSTYNDCVQWGETQAFTKNQPNPLTGGGDEEKYAYNCNNDEVLTYDDQMNNFVEKIGNNYHYHLYAMGKNSHIFNLDSINKIGISTNPSTATMINMVSYNEPYLDNKNLRVNYLNGISIEIIEENTTNGTIKVRICFDDIDIENNVRWCSDSIVLNETPTLSGYSLNVKQGKTITLDQGLTATRMSDPITFNGQKIFASPTTFTIQPAVRIHIDTTAKIVLENSSKLHLRENSECVIEDNEYIEVKCGTIFQLDDCASLVINGRGRLVADSGAILRVSNHAFIECEYGLQNLDIDTDAIIQDGFANPTSFLTPSVENIQINGNVTWENYNKIISGIVTINNGAILNVKSSFLRFKDETCGINVDRGGKLIIDNSTLTSLCANDNTMWRGIEVWGNHNANQYPDINGNYMQGYLELKNGATIENAICAAELMKPSGRSFMGGIIHANDAVFHNNAKAVHAYAYTNHNPITGNETDYNGWFRKCSFIIDNNYYEGKMFFKHVDLNYVDGIKFEGCNFSITSTSDSISPTCMGISAIDAGFRVLSYCDDIISPCPENSYERSTFTGFDNGIFSISQGIVAHTFTVKESIFTNNSKGIYAENVGSATIVGNEFNIGDQSQCNYGIYAINVSDFCIEENIFGVTNESSNNYTYGIGIVNSESINDIYRNTFAYLYCGNLACGVNNTIVGNTKPGLTYSCNENTMNEIDFFVQKYNGHAGIQSTQGSTLLPAGNTFSASTYHFNNDGDFDIDYYYNANVSDEIPEVNKIKNVNLNQTTSYNDCASHYGSGGGNVLKSPEEKGVLADTYKVKNDEYIILKTQYESQITAGVVPQSDIVAQMIQCLHDRNMAAGDIVRSNLNENEANFEELRMWLGKMQTLANDRIIVASYIHEGDFKNALALANTLPNVYNLQGDNLVDYNDYMTLLYIYQSLFNSDRTIHEMTEREYATVFDISEHGVGTSQSMAKAIMIELSDSYENNCLCLDLTETNDRETISNTDYVVKETAGFMIKLRPMPANSMVSVDYKLPEGQSNATLTIINPIGIKVVEIKLETAQNSITLDISRLNPGIYLLKVDMGDGKEYTEKIIVE